MCAPRQLGELFPRRCVLVFAAVVALLVPLCVPQVAKADTITPAQYAADLNLVNAAIANNASAFANSSAAMHDYTAGVLIGAEGLWDLKNGDNAGAQADFQAAISDFNGVLLVLGLPPLPGSASVPEPPTVLQLRLGIAVLGLVAGMKRRQARYRHASAPAA